MCKFMKIFNQSSRVDPKNSDDVVLFEPDPFINISELPLRYSINPCSINLLYSTTKPNIESVVRIMFETLMIEGVKFRFNSSLSIWTCLYETSHHEPATAFEMRVWNKDNQLMIEPRQLSGSNWSFKSKYISIIDRLLITLPNSNLY